MKFLVARAVAASVVRQVWSLTVPVGATKADLENPKCYSELASLLNIEGLKPHEYPHVEVTDEEGTFFARGVVVSNIKQKVQVKITNFTEVGVFDHSKAEKADADKKAADALKESEGAGSEGSAESEGNAEGSDAEGAGDPPGETDDTEGETEGEGEGETEDPAVFSEEAFNDMKEGKPNGLTHFVKWGAGAKWQIIDKSDGKVLETGLDKQAAFIAHGTYE